jgi:hypothetical protein
MLLLQGTRWYRQVGGGGTKKKSKSGNQPPPLALVYACRVAGRGRPGRPLSQDVGNLSWLVPQLDSTR